MRIKEFQKKILAFYKKQKRDLPWRKTKDPYYILISEIMLQQTQVDRVIPYYNAWIKTWPTIKALAGAKRREVLKQWMGLGYNNRAVNLHNTAQKIVEEYRGDVIEGVKQYKNLPGIGPYTSAAVRIFSLNEDIVTVDTNIRRILIHEFQIKENTSDQKLRSLAEQCLPQGKSRDWHNALMDYGAVFLTSRKTGIKPKTTQSRFEGSDRQIRARILRHLLTGKTGKSCSFTSLMEAMNLVDKKRTKRILECMVADSLVRYSGKIYYLASD